MKWSDRVALLFGAASPLAFGGDADALPMPGNVLLEPGQPAVDRDAWVYADPAERQRLLYLAAHRSHSSHRSHRSHYSGSGSTSSHSSHYSGSYVAPSPPPPPPAPKPRAAPRPSAGRSGSGIMPFAAEPAPGEAPADVVKRPTGGEIEEFVRKVQIALMMKGYDPGSADGVMGTKTKDALKQFQEISGLPATGNMDVETLRRLGVIN